MIRGTRGATVPMILALRCLDWEVVDAREPASHQSIFVELPVLVPVRAEPIFRVVVPFVREANGDPIFIEGPELLYEPIIQLLSPLPSKKRDDFRASFRELGPISPIGIGRVRQGDLFWVARIPAILGLPYLDDGGFTCERGKGGAALGHLGLHWRD